MRIPVVVHVIHNGTAIGTGANISDAQVMSQIQVLNEDYRRIVGTQVVIILIQLEPIPI